MIGPILLALVMSFNDGATLAFPPKGFSLRWYAALLDPVRSEPIHSAARNSFETALAVVVVVTLLTAPAAFALARAPRRFAGTVEPLLLAPWCCQALSTPCRRCWRSACLGLGRHSGLC